VPPADDQTNEVLRYAMCAMPTASDGLVKVALVHIWSTNVVGS